MQTPQGRKQGRMPRWWLILMLGLVIGLAPLAYRWDEQEKAREEAIRQRWDPDDDGFISEDEYILEMILEDEHSVPSDYGEQMRRVHRNRMRRRDREKEGTGDGAE